MPVVRESPDGGLNYPKYVRGRCYEKKLTAAVPSRPAAVHTYDWNTGTGRLLAADFDVSLARNLNVPDPVAWVAGEARSFAALIRGLGGAAIVDRAPTGGHHVYVLFSRPLPFEELRTAALALSVRYKSLDPKPMLSKFGLITVPGSPHKLDRGTGRLTGHRTLVTSLEAAQRAVRAPCGPGVWSGLVQELTAEAEQVRSRLTAPTAGPSPATESADVQAAVAELPHDDAGMPWRPLVGGRRPLPEALATIAATGQAGAYDGDSSRARQAVLTSAAARGWRYGQVFEQIRSGAWSGLADLYAHRSQRGRMGRLLPFEWQKAVAAASGAEPASNSDTRGKESRPPSVSNPPEYPAQTATVGGSRHPPVQCKDLGPVISLSHYQMIRLWQNALHVAEHDAEQRAEWGKAAGSIRRVLRAIGRAAQVSGSPLVAFGCRSLAESAQVCHETVAQVLARLRAEADPFLVLEEEHHEADADLYSLRVPDQYRDAALWRRWRRGMFDAIHPVFRATSAMSVPAAFVYEALSTCEALAGDLATAAAVSPAAVSRALRELAALGLAERGDDGWRRGPTSLEAAAHETGADLEAEQVHAAHVEQRKLWHVWLATVAELRKSRSRWQIPDDWTEIIPTDPGPDYAPPDLLHPPPDDGPSNGQDELPPDTAAQDLPAANHRQNTTEDTALELLRDALGTIVILERTPTDAEAAGPAP